MYNNTGSRSKGGGMAFILGETIRAQIYQLNGPLIARINHAALLFSEVTALLDAGDNKIAQGDREHINTIQENIKSLRDSYEPILDDPEARQASNKKRATSEKLLDLTRYYLLYLIEKYKLVDASIMKDIQGVTWGAE
ncbi:MAG: hypothetical protein PHW56_11330 [Methanosarcinaceae archaeon]|nr:hypothetical protein [Methanosarcinaceae archaeon]